MTRYKLTLEYDGTEIHGWQRQDDVVTGQQLLEDAIKGYCGQEIETVAAGRTDAGVHARGQVVHLDLDKDVTCYSIQQGINHHMKGGPVSVLNVEEVDDEFHARFNAKMRHYTYLMTMRQAPLVLAKNRAWQVHEEMMLCPMKRAAEMLEGKHNLSSFRAADCQSNSPIKTISYIGIEQQEDNLFFNISAPSFMYNQVRIIVGTLYNIGKGKWKAEDMVDILAAKDRTKAGPTAPPHGLYLTRVDY